MEHFKALTLSPLARLGVQIVRVETLRLVQLLQHRADVLHALAVDGVAGDVAQVSVLEVDRAELGEDAAAAAGPAVVLAAARAEVDERVGDAGGRLEGWQHLVRHVLRFIFEQRVAGERVSGEKAADEADVGLEHGDVGRLLMDTLKHPKS